MNVSRCAIYLALLCNLFAAGCAQLNVRHLERQPLRLQQESSLRLEFWRFDYQPQPLEESYAVSGRAYPLVEGLPQWATHLEELWFAVYLNDSSGNVLAKDVQILPPADFSENVVSTGIPFSFNLEPEDIAQSGQLYVTFGYRMVLTPDPSAPQTGEDGQPLVFFANEGALSRL